MKVLLTEARCPECGLIATRWRRCAGQGPWQPIPLTEDTDALRKPSICAACGSQVLLSTEPVHEEVH